MGNIPVEEQLKQRMEQKLDAFMQDCQDAQEQGANNEAQFGMKWCAWLAEELRTACEELGIAVITSSSNKQTETFKVTEVTG